jgi:hypothetical protein
MARSSSASDRILIRVLHAVLFPLDRPFDLGKTHRWRPLRTARLRWRVDQTWTRHAPLAGAAALRVMDLAWQGDPSYCPRHVRPGRQSRSRRLLFIMWRLRLRLLRDGAPRTFGDSPPMAPARPGDVGHRLGVGATGPRLRRSGHAATAATAMACGHHGHAAPVCSRWQTAQPPARGVWSRAAAAGTRRRRA